MRCCILKSGKYTVLWKDRTKFEESGRLLEESCFKLRLKDEEELVRKSWGWDEIEKHFRQTDCICASSAATKRLDWITEHEGKCRPDGGCVCCGQHFDLIPRAMGSH